MKKESMDGYLYCIYNKMYDTYGNNIYKLGNMKNKSRMNGYVTSYIDPVEIKLISNKIVDKIIGEKILFDILSQYRIKPNREFFNCELSMIQKAINEVEIIMKKESIDNLRDMYLPISKEQVINNMIFIQKTNEKNIDKFEIDNDGDCDSDSDGDSDSYSDDITDKIITGDNSNIVNDGNINDNENNDDKIYNKYKIYNIRLEEKLQIQLTPEIIKKWHKKEYILDNALCAIGKKQYNNSEDPYFSNMGIKIEYLNKILNIFGFRGVLDFETKVEFNKELEKRMIDSGLLIRTNYSIMMKTFNKQEKANDLEGIFKKDKYIKICNCVLNEFGFKIQSKFVSKRINKKLKRIYTYYLEENMINIKKIIELYT